MTFESAGNVLIIDDVLENLHLLSQLLLEHGYYVRAAKTGREGLASARSTPPDLILLDIRLPDLNGYDVCAELKTDPATRDVPVLFLSALSDTRDKLKGFEVGALDYITKPFQAQEVVARVRTHVELYRLRDRLREKEENLREALSTMGRMGFWEFDVVNRTTFWSAQMYAQYERDPALGPPTEDEDVGWYLPEQRRQMRESLRLAIDTGRESHYDFRLTLPNGIRKDFAAFVRTLKNEIGDVVKVIGIVQDISERKQAKERIQSALQEKNLLLRELYHRTKNNMQVITSMLKLQALYTDEQQVKDVFQAMENRIGSMALVHQKLYQSENLSRISLDEYIRELADLLFNSYHISQAEVSLHCELEPLFAVFDIAVPCGLMVNELLSNALKYAFPDGRTGNIVIRLHRTDSDELELQVADDGVGVAEDFDFQAGSRLGLQSVFAVAEHQLQGSVKFDRQSGFACSIRFRDSVYNERV